MYIYNEARCNVIFPFIFERKFLCDKTVLAAGFIVTSYWRYCFIMHIVLVGFSSMFSLTIIGGISPYGYSSGNLQNPCSIHTHYYVAMHKNGQQSGVLVWLHLFIINCSHKFVIHSKNVSKIDAKRNIILELCVHIYFKMTKIKLFWHIGIFYRHWLKLGITCFTLEYRQ